MIRYREPPIVSAEAATVAQEHIAWARALGLAPREIGAPWRLRTESWEAAAAVVALAWQTHCARRHN